MKLKLETMVMRVVVILISFIIFAESYFDTSILIVMCICILGIRFIAKTSQRLSIANICILTIIVLLCFTLLILPIYNKTIMMILKTCSLLIIEMFLEREKGWGIGTIKVFRGFACVFVIATLVQVIAPSVIENINQMILSAEGLAENKELYRNGAYAGITMQTGTTSFYISICVMFTFINTLYLKKNQYIWLVMGILALWLTAKRGPLIFCISSMFLLVVICNKNLVKNILKVAKYSIILLGGIIVLYAIIPEMRIMIYKFLFVKDISSGRFTIYRNVFELFKDHPILGNGIGSIAEKIGVSAHNIYLMLWCEVGVILGTFIIVIMVGHLVGTIIKIRKKCLTNQGLPIRYVYSLAIQCYILMYGLTGNVLTETSQLMTYLVFCAIIKDEKFIGEKYEKRKNNRKSDLQMGVFKEEKSKNVF